MFQKSACGLAAILAVAVAASVPVGASAQEARKYGPVDTGTLVSVDAERGIFTIESGNLSKTFGTDEATVVEVGGDPLELSDLDLGDRVTVGARHGEVDEYDRPVAAYVQVVRDTE